jgi:hypothetical protein
MIGGKHFWRLALGFARDGDGPSSRKSAQGLMIDLFDVIESRLNFKTVQYWTEVDSVMAYALMDLDRETL